MKLLLKGQGFCDATDLV